METYTKNLTLGKIPYTSDRRLNECCISLEIERRVNPKRDFNTLQFVPDYYSVSFGGCIWNAKKTDHVAGGQIVGDIRSFFAGNAKVQRICELWKRWHLNDMKSGTAVQLAYLAGYEKSLKKALLGHLVNFKDFETRCNLLQEAGLLVDRGHRFGNLWLVEQVPEDVLNEIKQLFEAD